MRGWCESVVELPVAVQRWRESIENGWTSVEQVMLRTAHRDMFSDDKLSIAVWNLERRSEK